ncbi:Protein of unknown function [Pyronema omphalodes CBS 100304]|uniref:Uncharacterized protein n=1 Tax=Pyronema omphalodes (strain CBS 100304) TaxID=1076935 RepID=U4LDY1_PYROM|nr:Protein of unknown function [Pyronema omphalodes CBS 100304]
MATLIFMKVSQGQYNRLRIEIQINYFRILYGIIRIMAEALGIASGISTRRRSRSYHGG